LTCSFRFLRTNATWAATRKVQCAGVDSPYLADLRKIQADELLAAAYWWFGIFASSNWVFTEHINRAHWQVLRSLFRLFCDPAIAKIGMTRVRPFSDGFLTQFRRQTSAEPPTGLLHEKSTVFRWRMVRGPVERVI